DFHGVARAGEIQVIGFDSACLAILAGIGMDRNEEVGLGLVGDFRAAFERDESVVVPGKYYIGTRQLQLNDFAQPQRYIEAQVFFHEAGWTNRAGIMSAVSGIDDDAADLESQRACQGMLAVAG